MIARTKKYIREIKLEWDKVSKPEWKDVQGNTLVVIVACGLLGLFLWAVDGNTEYPEWFSIHGMIVIIGIVLIVSWIVRRYTLKWKLAIPISLIPLILVLFSQFVLNQSIQGFGLALLRSLFIRTG
jgi:preprotein translocase SecE subunit